jgi:hypothetical protein
VAPKQVRTRAATVDQVRVYVAKASEYLEAAEESLEAGRFIAATSLAIHAAINAADAVTGMRLGLRSAGDDHSRTQVLLAQAGPDGADVSRHLSRLLPLKTRAEYDPDDIPPATAKRAVDQSRRCVALALRVCRSL